MLAVVRSGRLLLASLLAVCACFSAACTDPPEKEMHQAQGAIEPDEMARTFNCGIGMAVIVAADVADDVTRQLTEAGETVHRIGHIAGGEKGCTVAGSVGTWAARADWSATHHG